MSGGTFNYKNFCLDDISATISRRAENNTQRAFAVLIAEVGAALYELDLHYSGDRRDPEPESVLRLLGKERRIEQAVADGKSVIEELKKLTGDEK